MIADKSVMYSRHSLPKWQILAAFLPFSFFATYLSPFVELSYKVNDSNVLHRGAPAWICLWKRKRYSSCIWFQCGTRPHDVGGEAGRFDLAIL